MRYRQVTTTGSTIYYLDKLMEIEQSSSNVDYRHYLGDVAVLTKTGSLNDPSPGIQYTFRDRLGGISALGDPTGLVTETRGYDAYGKPRNGSWTNKTTPTINSGVTERGFTDHEHIDEWQLIHMNGRGYDYNLGRFLSVDPIIQDPSNSQSVNSFAYIMNNPLSGTDPTGYCAAKTGSHIRSCVDVKVTAINSISGKTSTRTVSVNRYNGADALSRIGAAMSNTNRAAGVEEIESVKLVPNSQSSRQLAESIQTIGTEEAGAYLVQKDSATGDWVRQGRVPAIETDYAAINGQWNDVDRATELMGTHVEFVASRLGDQISEYTLLHNPTHGQFSDTLESFFDKVGLTTDVTRQFSTLIHDAARKNSRTTIIGHSQGGIILAASLRRIGGELRNLRVAFHAGGNNRWVADRIIEKRKVEFVGYLEHPYDPVPNIAGFNEHNPIRLVKTLLKVDDLFRGPDKSPHTLPYAAGDYEK